MDSMKLTLRPITEQDTSAIVRWRNRDDVRRNLFTQSLLTEDQHLAYYRSVVLPGLCRQYILVMEDPAPMDIGTAFLKKIDWEQGQAEFGIFIGEPQGRGKHLSSQAAGKVLKIAFSELNLRRVYLSVLADNLPALRSYAHVGFRECGREREGFCRDGVPVDVIYMDITKEQWEGTQFAENQGNTL